MNESRGVHRCLVLCLVILVAPLVCCNPIHADEPLPGYVRTADILAKVSEDQSLTPIVKTFLTLMIEATAFQDKLAKAKEIIESGEGSLEDVDEAGETLDRHRIDPSYQSASQMDDDYLNKMIDLLKMSQEAVEKELKSVRKRIRRR